VVLGTKGTTLWYTGDEHNIEGHISEDPVNRARMMEKRMKKLELALKEIPLEDKIAFYGDPASENVVVSWGSPKGAILEALGMLKEEGLGCGFLQLRLFSPFPAAEVKQALAGKKRVIDVEDNYLGQAGQVIKEETGIAPNFYILKYTGRPVTTTEVYNAIKQILTGKAAERQVLTFGN
jgi:2-oxoglutarate ferredoxin oxidoreductase subunit alpha